MKIAIHQPNFFPWIGYFFKIKMADTFVFLDDVEFTKQSFTKRVRINHQADFSLGRYLSIPLQNHSDQSLIKDIVVSSEHISNWWREMIAIVHNTYCHSPYYQETMTFLQTVVQKVETEKKLTTVNQIVIAEIADYLDLETDFILSSNIEKGSDEEHINHKICKSLSATLYVSGIGAKKYQAEHWYAEHEIEIEYFDISKTKIKKEYPTHLLDKSIISWLMLYGKQGVASIFQN